jgi:uncharacterized protein YcsI (UPF0317 family)
MAPTNLTTGQDVRLASRDSTFQHPTPGLAPHHLQANLIILPSSHASDFRLLCRRNPVPCPLLAESASPGDYQNLKSHIPGVTGEQIAKDLDLRRDAPRYMVYQDGEAVESERGCLDVEKSWDSNDHIAFLIGCSFSFESALIEAGLGVSNITHGKNVPMYQTTLRLNDAGRFQNRTYVVSMRPYELGQIEAVKEVTRPFELTHGEPIAWGWKAVKDLGIKDITNPEYGDKPVCMNGEPFTEESGEVPVFWGCGVTPQDAVLGKAVEGVVLGHLPGHMLVLDLKEEDVFK